MAEREGFEPPVLLSEHTRSPGVPDQPLWHLSVNGKQSGDVITQNAGISQTKRLSTQTKDKSKVVGWNAAAAHTARTTSSRFGSRLAVLNMTTAEVTSMASGVEGNCITIVTSP